MDEIILRSLSGRASSFDEERLRRWRREDPAHEARFRELVRLWEATAFSRTVARDDAGLDAQVAAVVAEAELRRSGRLSPHPLARPRRTIAWVAGATALAAGVAALALGVPGRAPQPAGAPVEAASAEGAAQPSRALDLPDGSVALLAPGARAEVRMEGGIREVVLHGRAFFAVVHDEHRPFVIRAGDSEIRVLGTRFEVGEEGDGVRTVVVEGRVSLSSPRGEVELPEGSVGVSTPAAPPAAETVEDVHALLDWPGGTLVFRGTPLEVVAREVGRHFGASLEVRGAALAGMGISASFRDENFAEVVETLCAVTGARCEREGASALMAEREGGVR